MIELVWPSTSRYYPQRPATLEIGEIDDYDFAECAQQVFRVLHVLEICGLIHRNPYHSTDEALDMMLRLIDDIDTENDELQISEKNHIRVEFRDELLSIEVYIGV